MADLRVAKFEIPLEVTFDVALDKSENFVLFLNQYSRFHADAETLEELLNCGQAFLPAKKAMTSKTVLLNLARVAFVREKKKSAEKGTRTLIIHFDGGYTLQVQPFQIPPPRRERTVDIFNGRTTFLAFLSEGGKVHINKNKILKVTEL